MKNMLLLSLIFIFSQHTDAQVGLNVGVKMMNAAKWTDFLNTENQSNSGNYNGFHIGVDYWFRLKEKRIEFFPEVSYEKYSQDFGLIKDDISTFNFYLNTNFYLFDFEGDCNCPTFSKGGDFFEKGFFIQVSPGISYFRLSANSEINEVSDSDSSFGIGLGAGLDIGISDFLTITPIVKYTWLPNVSRDELATFSDEDLDASVSQFYGGIRIGIRWTE
jgi:opacity protein-like surface antigen